MLCAFKPAHINRKLLVERNNPEVTSLDSLAAFTVGNGEFAYTVDVTGLQTFPKQYENGIPLGTQSQWGWHSFPNTEHYTPEETLKDYYFRGRKELYAVQFNEDGRQKDASNWYRVNLHRLHLGIIGFEMTKADLSAISDIDQKLDMWNGAILSKFKYHGAPMQVKTVCHPVSDAISVSVSSELHPAIKLHFPYPTGGHVDDACDWNKNDLHQTLLVEQSDSSALLKRIIDDTQYFVKINWSGKARLYEKSKNYFLLQPASKDFTFTAHFVQSKDLNETRPISFSATEKAAADYWENYWNKGAAVDFSKCKDKRAKELERRVVLSQYLLGVQCVGSTPPQETGLTYNSWYGKFHLEMIWWHEAQFALWNRPELLERTLEWYFKALPEAQKIASRQGFKGARWMKMTDTTAIEAPSKVGSFLIWQEPHIIYLAELIYRSNLSEAFLKKYATLIDETAKFMYSFADYDMLDGRYVLQYIIPAQETLKVTETVNPPLELSYWYFALNIAQKWRERLGQKRNLQWDEMLDKLSPLASKDGLYLAAESVPETYSDIRFTSDHMAVLGAYGMLPKSPLVRKDIMQNTLNWIWDNWNWGKTWGWDYPLTAMNAARLGDAEKAIGALLMDKRTNTYLVDGHNYQDSRLRIYLPGNGGLLTAVAMMCAGWDGCKTKNPGFPKNGKWNVRWEGLHPMP
ncbi:MAG: hypothetical protein PHH37_01815 [Paludibacter sp.]|nr:hypothetical protein [Paludibacter sp.]